MLDVTFLLSAFVILLVTIAPFETAPVFVGLARPLSPDDRRRTVRHAVVISGLVLVAFALVGKGLLGLLHVSLPALRTAGSVLLMSQAAGNPWHIAGVIGMLALCLLLAALAMQYVFDGLNEGLLKRLT